MRKKKGRRYSYTNHDSRKSNFLNKNFNKTDSYKTNFSESNFTNTSLIGAKFKFCAFYGTIFESCYIRGSLFRGCNLRSSIFKNCIVSASNFNQCKLKGVRFIGCKIISTTRIDYFLPNSSFSDVEFFKNHPAESLFSPELIHIVNDLRGCDLIRRSTVLHRKRGKLDTVSLKMLVDTFGEEFLIKNLGGLPEVINREFYSLSYIVRALQKKASGGKVDLPGSAALGAPKLNE